MQRADECAKRTLDLLATLYKPKWQCHDMMITPFIVVHHHSSSFIIKNLAMMMMMVMFLMIIRMMMGMTQNTNNPSGSNMALGFPTIQDATTHHPSHKAPGCIHTPLFGLPTPNGAH